MPRRCRTEAHLPVASASRRRSRSRRGMRPGKQNVGWENSSRSRTEICCRQRPQEAVPAVCRGDGRGVARGNEVVIQLSSRGPWRISVRGRSCALIFVALIRITWLGSPSHRSSHGVRTCRWRLERHSGNREFPPVPIGDWSPGLLFGATQPQRVDKRRVLSAS